MGQKVHPYGLRLGINKNWKSIWFSKKGDYSKLLHEDFKIRKYIKQGFANAGVSSIEIARAKDRARITLFTSRPGVIIGRRGADIDRLRDELQEITGKQIYIDIKEIKTPEIEAQLVAENVAYQLEKRIAFRRAMKKAIQVAMNSGAGGIKIACAGRLGGADMSRKMNYREGKIPLQTFRADIDFGFAEAHTAYGTIGVKVWVYKGEIYSQKKESSSQGVKDGTNAKKGKIS
jgi:small subunit ribosomal protein S3